LKTEAIINNKLCFDVSLQNFYLRFKNLGFLTFHIELTNCLCICGTSIYKLTQS